MKTPDAFRARLAEIARRIHHRQDAHLIVEGHELIVGTILEAVSFEPPSIAEY